MSKIPFVFTPIPKFFSDIGLLKNHKMCAFLMWAFSRCNSEKRTVYHIHSIVELEPFEFIFGRTTCSEETGLTEMEVRGCIHQLNGTRFLKILEKVTSKTTNKFTVYRWILDGFLNDDNQQNNQQTTSRQPAEQPQIRKNKNIRKKDDPPKPPVIRGADHHLFSKSGEKLIEIHDGVFMTQAEIDECILARGDRETVELIIQQICGTKYNIKNWVDNIKKWNIKEDLQQKIIEHETLAKKLETMYADTESGWTCRIYNDKRKDQKGLLFEGRGAYVEPIFIPFSYYDFKQQVAKIIRDKRMQKSLEKQEQLC